jgi:hypothetical protein
VTKISDRLYIDIEVGEHSYGSWQLAPAGFDNFVALNHLNQPTLIELTFIDDPDQPGEVKWMRNRQAVLERQAQ